MGIKKDNIKLIETGRCEKCGGVLKDPGLGIYVCSRCGHETMSEFGKIKKFIEENGGEVDYIHGENDLINLTESGFTGILLPSIKKEDFFSLIVKGGNLPKKTFSMGEGYEKRYYVEAKRIKRV